MEDHSDSTGKLGSQHNQVVQKKKFSIGKFLFRLILVGVIAGGGYFAFTNYGERLGFNKSFDQQVEPEAEYESISSINEVEGDTLISVIDSAAVSISDSSSVMINERIKEEREGGFFDVNTEYGELEAPEEAIREAAIAAHDQELVMEIEAEQVDEMIDEIIAPMNLLEEEVIAFKQFYKDDILSSGSVIDLIAVTGNHFLGGEDTSLDKDILNTLLISEEVVSIVIADRNGRIVFSTDRKQMNRSIKTAMPDIDLSAQSLIYTGSYGYNTVTIPLFRGYGRNGTAVLITKAK